MRKYPWWLVLAVLIAGCSRAAPQRRADALPRTLPLEVLADRPLDSSLPVMRLPPAPSARLELLRIAPQRPGVAPPPPDAAPAAPPVSAEQAERLPADDQLRPPVPRGGTVLRLTGARARWVELDVRVDESGAVSDAELAGGDADSALVRAAIAAVRATRWYPAQRAGRAVAVWSRQRLEVGR